VARSFEIESTSPFIDAFDRDLIKIYISEGHSIKHIDGRAGTSNPNNKLKIHYTFIMMEDTP